jgi:hypothetical protein
MKTAVPQLRKVTPAVVAHFEAALLLVQSGDIRKWAAAAGNRAAWLQLAAFNLEKTEGPWQGPSGFAAYIAATAIGL